MGTQQILLLVLSMIIIGIIVVVGINIFNMQEYNSNKRSLASELATYPPLIMKYWETRQMLGGAEADTSNVTMERVAGYIGLADANYSTSSENGELRVTAASGTTVELQGLGVSTRKGKRPLIKTTIDLSTKQVSTEVKDASDFE